MDNGIIHRLFLKEHEASSFIIQQKATVLTWSHLILIPVVTSYFFINLMRNNARELMGVFFIDLSFLAALTIGLVLIRKGKYQTDVNSIIIITTILTILGHLVKRHVQVETGANSYCVLMYAVMIFTAMFSTRKILTLVSIIFLALTLSMYVFAIGHAQSAVHFHLLSSTLNNIIVIIIALCLSYQNGIITDRALEVTEQELRTNAELNRTLEQKVEERTEKLKESMSQIKVLSGLIPICANCKKIRDDSGYWNQLESYIKEHSEAIFSHGICPDCTKELYPEEYAEMYPDGPDEK